MHTRERGRK